MTQTFDPARHIPVVTDVPEEPVEELSDRDDIPPPNAYARGAVVTHRRTQAKAVIHRVDLVTRQMRLYYPDRPEGQRYESRTTWHPLDEWEPEITLSPQEVERQNAKKEFATELEGLDADGLEAVLALCDDPDPLKQLSKLRALKKIGMIKLPKAAKP